MKCFIISNDEERNDRNCLIVILNSMQPAAFTDRLDKSMILSKEIPFSTNAIHIRLINLGR